MRRKKTADTEALATEIVSLKNRLADLEDQGATDTDEWSRLHGRLRKLQDQLAGAPANGGEAPQGGQVRYVPPV